MVKLVVLGTCDAEHKAKEEKTAKQMMAAANIPYYWVGPSFTESDEIFPYIDYGVWRFEGLAGIRRFIDLWKVGKLPA